MTAEADIAAISDGGANTAAKVRTALTAVLGRADFTFADFTPTWTGTGSNPAIGNGSISGKWVQHGELVIAHYRLTTGSTTTYGSGNYRFSIPPGVTISQADWPSPARVVDASASFASFLGSAQAVGGGTPYVDIVFSTGAWTPTNPITLASGDAARATVMFLATT